MDYENPYSNFEANGNIFAICRKTFGFADYAAYYLQIADDISCVENFLDVFANAKTITVTQMIMKDKNRNFERFAKISTN